MEITLVQYLIVCPLVFLAGLMDSIAGGGGLISLPAFMIAGIPAHLSLGSNKMCSVMGTVVSTARFAKNGFINFKTSVWFAVAALIGSSIGSHLILMVSEGIIEKLMLVILPVVAVYVLWNKNLGDDSKAGTISAGRKFAVSLAAAFIVGAYDGFYGPGTGTFLILILTGAARYTMKEAAGTTKVINLASNAAAFATFLLNGKVLIPLGFISGLFCILGHYIGSGLVLTNGKKIVRPVVLIVLVILFVKVLMG
ncbi:MAG: TSUP family transporter [Clostridium sp.]|nr:TSUP family transporter [Clostridium sp.]MEE1497623.1 TSUP family transporter [Clostridium sp.]